MSWNFTQVLRQFHPYDVQFKRGKKTVLIGILNVTLSLFWKCERHVWGKVSEAMIKPSLQSQRKPSSTRASRTRTSATVENHAGFTPQDEEKGRKNDHTWQFKIKEKCLITDLHVQCACHYVG